MTAFHSLRLTSYVITHDKNVIHVQYEEDEISYIGLTINAWIIFVLLKVKLLSKLMFQLLDVCLSP